MIENHIVFFLYTIIFIHSTIGYGYIFSKIIGIEAYKSNIGLRWFIGIFFNFNYFNFYSFFFAHSYSHNILLHLFGLLSGLIFIYKNHKFNELKNLFILTSLLFVGLYVLKATMIFHTII